ncbi:spore maturation protein B [Caloramator quimbayensis]|uniref:Spore maturation protein B n=1 Tax=Caloramator quimbayensis TaxID=1147123 RepID=A0A1T4WHU0_9CLOT|nr:nucleoside recognition domain-containing protein [Caloramator quimbayensis]SKA76739.1 spore maturation protein B [Caloramator quimbayensis]
MNIGVYFLPLLILFILIYSFIKKVKVYETFIEGVKEGFSSVYSIAPYLLTMLFAIDIFRKSGAMDYFIYALKPLSKILKIPEGVIPMILIKPLSGSGALGVMTDTMKQYGVDSIEGKIAAVMMGSTETIFYTISIYFGSVNVKDVRHSLKASLIAHIIGSLAAVYICYYFFR